MSERGIKTQSGLPATADRFSGVQMPNPPGLGAAREGIFTNLDEAVNAASKAQIELVGLTLAKRKEIVAAVRVAAQSNAETLSVMAVNETGLGRYEDKVKKNCHAAASTPGIESLETVACTGDRGLTLMERAPYGVIASVAPVTNPSETIISNGIGMISGGNSVVFNAHPSAKGVTNATIDLLNRAIIGAGGPSNVFTAVAEPTIDSAKALMRHRLVELVVVTGGMAVVREAMTTGKKVIAAGPGNPPVVVDETADLENAAVSVVNGASFDNNIICICEKTLIVVNSVADSLKAYMKKHGAYEANKWLGKRLEHLLFEENRGPWKAGTPNKSFVGKNAGEILAAAGMDGTKEDVKLIFVEVEPDHPFVWSELLMPVIPLVRVRDVDSAISLAVKSEHGFRHSALMHSRNIEKLSEMAQKVNTAIFTKNGPSYAGLGFGGEGYGTFTIATSTGEGLTCAKHFTRERRCVLVDYFRIV